MYHSQNNEAEIVLNYFNGRIGTLLDIGANDGKTFSNSYDLIQNGWEAVLLEPSPVAFEKCSLLHIDNDKVSIYCYGIGNKTGMQKFYESGAHVPNGNDCALVSSIHESETERWRNANVYYKETEVFITKWKDRMIPNKKFNFITIDAEGCDWEILQQIDLKEVGCECLCIEWNSKDDLANLFTEYCGRFSLKEINRNAENIIFAL